MSRQQIVSLCLCTLLAIFAFIVRDFTAVSVYVAAVFVILALRTEAP